MNYSETSSRPHVVGRPRAIKEKKSPETLWHGEEKLEPDSSLVDNDRIRIHRLLGEQLSPQCTVGHTQAGGGSIMLWMTFSRVLLGPVVVVE
ncbi:hypothetical protein TNCV_2234141 [Trichonephila clavipes]|nr:hypothetical protein TNCV_2234141 [Trichonephila clavipes]